MTGSSSQSFFQKLFSAYKDTKESKADIGKKSFGQKALFACLAVGASVFFLDTVVLKNNLLPSQPAKFLTKAIFPFTYPVSALKRIGNYWTDVDDTLLLGCAPMNFLCHPETLHKLNVRGVINLCDEYEGPEGKYCELGIEQLYLPTLDHNEPSYLQMVAAVDFISKYKMRGERVLVHCKAGHARSATIALCWLLNEDSDLDPPAANMVLEGKRNVKNNMYLRDNVHKFHSELSKKRDSYKNFWSNDKVKSTKSRGYWDDDES